MNKKLTAFLLTLCLAVFLACPVFAETVTDPAASETNLTVDAATATDVTSADVNYVSDSAQVLSQDEAAALNDKCAALAQQYSCAVYVVTTDTLVNSDAYDDAKSIYQENGLGYGDDKSGILLLDVVTDRKYAVIAFGKGNTILTDYGREGLIEDYLVPQLKAGDYNAAFSDSVDRIGEYMELNAAGTPYDVESEDGGGAKALVVICIPLIIALIVCLVFKSQMKTAVEATEADDYLLRDQFHVTKHEDRFLYQTVTVVHHEHDDSDGGTTIDSDGFSGSSGSY